GDDREDQIERADVLVVGGHEPAGEEPRHMMLMMLRPMAFVRLEMERVGGGAHRSEIRSVTWLGSRGWRRWEWPALASGWGLRWRPEKPAREQPRRCWSRRSVRERLLPSALHWHPACGRPSIRPR